MLPVETTIDSAGRIVVPKALREALGLTAGSTVDMTIYGGGIQLVPVSRTARLIEETGALVAHSETIVTDEMIFSAIDAGRR